MKILYLTPYSPIPPTFGGAIRIYHILKQLVERHEVTVAGYGDASQCEAVKKNFPELEDRVFYLDQPFHKSTRKLVLLYSMFSSHSHWYNMIMKQRMQQLLDDVMANHDFDLIQSEFPVLSHYEFNSDAVKVIDAHNVEYDNFRRMADKEDRLWKKFYYKQEARKFRQEELGTISQQDALFTTSQRDADLFHRDLPEIPKFVIPNGVDVNYFTPWDAVKEPYSLVFVGMMKYQPNIDAMTYFLDRIFPQIKKRVPNVKIYIVGGNPPSELLERRSSNVVITEFVPDVRPYINRSTVYVVPLRMGSGTRLKILEAMAMRIPIVTTSIGCEGLGLEHQETAMIADSAHQFMEYTVELIYNSTLRNRIIHNASELVHDRYSWTVVGQHLEEAYHKLVTNQVRSEINYTTNTK